MPFCIIQSHISRNTCHQLLLISSPVVIQSDVAAIFQCQQNPVVYICSLNQSQNTTSNCRPGIMGDYCLTWKKHCWILSTIRKILDANHKPSDPHNPIVKLYHKLRSRFILHVLMFQKRSSTQEQSNKILQDYLVHIHKIHSWCAWGKRTWIVRKHANPSCLLYVGLQPKMHH